MTTDKPTPEQLARLQQYAAEHGRYWKRDLNDAWQNGADAREQDGHLLRQVRNQLGPQWLQSFRL